MEQEGYDFNTAKGENLAVGYESAEEAMQAWKNSPAHNAAMLDGNYRVMGVARINVPGSVHGWYWTTDFGGYVDPSAHGPGEEPVRPAGPTARRGRSRKAAATEPVGPGRGRGRARPRHQRPRQRRHGQGRRLEPAAKDGADLILEDGEARLGGYDDGKDELEQKIRIGADATLAYDVKVKTGSGDPDDAMLLRLTDGKGKQVAVLKKYTGRRPAAGSADGWTSRASPAGRSTLASTRGPTTSASRRSIVDRVALRP